MGKKVKKNNDEDKDKSYRERLAICDKVVGELISMLLDGDNTYLTKGCVHERMMAVTKAKNQLRDPQFILQLLRNLMEPIIAENGSGDDVRDAFKALKSYLTQYANPVQKKRSAKRLPDSMSLTASQKEMVVQPEATVDQTQQLMTEDKLFSIVKNMVNDVLGRYLGRLQNQKLTNPVSIHGDPESSRGAEICNNIQVGLYMKDYVMILNSVIRQRTRYMVIRVKAPVVLEQIHTTWNCHKRIPLLLILFFCHCRVFLIWKTLVILDSVICQTVRYVVLRVKAPVMPEQINSI
ncbi:hypothetical protein V6Z11_D03G195800 [Gossypium hirsutum]